MSCFFFTYFSDKPKEECTKNEAEYLAGYSKCLAEISSFLEQTRTTETNLKKEIVDHVTGKIKGQLLSMQLPSADDVSDDSNTGACTSSLVPIAPSVGSSDSSSKVSCTLGDQPIDLSKNADLSFKPENLNSQETTKEFSGDPRCQGYSVCQPYPLGLLCGGQVMLLVQLPQSMTSQMTSQSNPAVAHQQPVVSSYLNQNSYTNTVFQNTVSSYQNSGQTAIGASVSGNPLFITNTTLSAHDGGKHATPPLQFLNCILPPKNEDSNNNTKGEHWRPW